MIIATDGMPRSPGSALRRRALAVSSTVVLGVLAWEMAFDINDPTIPLVRELLFTAGSLFGLCSFLILMLDGR